MLWYGLFIVSLIEVSYSKPLFLYDNIYSMRISNLDVL